MTACVQVAGYSALEEEMASCSDEVIDRFLLPTHEKATNVISYHLLE
jgi:hypothetical protein